MKANKRRSYPRTFGMIRSIKPLPLEEDPSKLGVTLAKAGDYAHVVVDDVMYHSFEYVVRPEKEAEQLRIEFNDCKRGAFIKSLVDDPSVQDALKMIFGDKYQKVLAAMRLGINPPKFEVHHIEPLHDSGTNETENLVLVDVALHRPVFHRGYWKWIRKYFRNHPDVRSKNVLLPRPKPGVKITSRLTSTQAMSARQLPEGAE